MKNLIANRGAEKDIREWLTRNGYYGTSAKFLELELHAIARPGWLQVFRFRVEAKTHGGEWTTLFGAVKDDDRHHNPAIMATGNFGHQQRQLTEWSTGLIRRQSKRSETTLPIFWAGAAVFGFVSMLFLLAVLIEQWKQY